MKNIQYLLFLALSFVAFNSCTEEVEEFKYVTFESPTFEFGVPIAGNATKGIKVYTSQIMKSDRTFQVQVVSGTSTTADPASYVVPTSVTIPANTNVGVLDVKVSDVNIGSTGKILTLQLFNDEEFYEGGTIKLNLTQICTQNDVRLNIILDPWGSECSWNIKNSSNVVVGSGGPYTDGLASVTGKFCLPDGTYTFTVNDAYGDGLGGPPAGKATLTKGTTVLAEIGGDFGSTQTKTFTLP
jgi:hypothetical protein